MSGLLELSRVGKSFPGVTALADVDLALRPGSVHALVGENGAGKSTLINLLSGLLQPDSGEIRHEGKRLHLASAQAAHRLGIVTVHQEVDLFGSLSVMENLGLEQGLATHGLGWFDWRKQRSRARAALERVGVDWSAAVLAETLSPGQRQLVEIAAALAQPCRVLILDEPTSSLSEKETQLLFSHIRRLREEGTAILYVSHRLEEIFALADEVTVLRDGRRVWSGPLADTSRTHLIAQMVGRTVEPAPLRVAPESGPIRFECRGLTAADGSFL